MKPKTPLDKPPLANGNGASLGHQLPKEVARPEPPLKPSSPARKPVGEQPVILEQPALWSRVFVWLIIGVTASALIWAAVAKIEEAVPAAGKLEPQGSVKAIKAPTGGVVRQIHVKDGQRVKKGQLLLAFDPTAPEADQASLTKLRETLLKENQFYSTQLKGSSPGTGGVDWESLLRLRAALVAENQYYKAQVDGSRPQGVGEFNATQRNLLASSQAESQSRVAAAQLQIQELTKQFSQTQAQLATANQVLALNQEIRDRLSPLVVEGALPKLQYQRQQEEALTRQAEVDRLTAEQQRLTVAIDRARQELQNTIAASTKETWTKIADNQKQIAEIDAQLSRTRLDNQKQIAQLEGQLSKAKQAKGFQELRSPVDGVVFDLQADAPGFVANASEPIVTIVPHENLVASVFLANKDIGFVQEGMEVDVNIESFPATEFGSLQGKLISIGSDALPPTQERPFYAFPAKVQLARQSFSVNDRKIPLQSGMSVNCSIKVRKRTVMSIFTSLFAKKIKSLETVR